MVKPASLPRYCGSLACLSLLLGSLPAIAQEAKPADSSKVQSEEAVFIPIEYRPPPYQISIGVRLSGKAKVKFSQLGSIPRATNPGEYNSNAGFRQYDNGYVGLDYSVDAEGKQFTVGDGKTNNFRYISSEQVLNDPDPAYPNGKAVAFFSSQVESTGESAMAENGSTLAWDLEISRELGGTKHFSWGILFGAGLSDLKANTSGTVKAKLTSIWDIYSAGGTPLPTETNNAVTPPLTSYPPYSANPGQWRYQTEWVDKEVKHDDGTTTTEKVQQIKTGADGVALIEYYNPAFRIVDHPTFERTTSEQTGIDVAGTWKVRGAYVTARFGPYIAARIGRHLQVRAAAGVTLTVLGARFLFEEKYLHPILNSYLTVDTDRTSNEATVTGTLGYFVEGELDWFFTQRTGIFIGATHEDFARDLQIKLGEQIASIDVSAGTAFRTGITTRF